jgi:hypothetical protein
MVLGAAVLVVSATASAHVDVDVGVGIPGPLYLAAQPESVEPPPVAYAAPPVVAVANIMIGGHMSGANIANCASVSGDATKSMSANGPDIMTGTSIEINRTATASLHVHIDSSK